MPVRPGRHKPATPPTARHEVPEQQSWGKGRGGRPWRRLRDQILRRDGHICQCDECRLQGAVKPAHEVDHIIPKSCGGGDTPSNLRAINRDCHAKKTREESRRGRRRGQ